MEIKFEDYLTEEERKQIVVDEFRSQCRKSWNEDEGVRLVGNVAYDMVLRLVNEAIGGDVKELIATKTIEVINNLSSFTVFSASDYITRADGVGRDALNEAIINSKPLIKQRLEAVINSLDESDITEMLRVEALSLLDSKLFGGRVI